MLDKKNQIPTPSEESERLEALRSYQLLDTLPEEQFDRLTKLAASICGVPIALVSLVDTDRQWFKSKVGLEAEETPRNISFCQHAIMDEHIFEVEDAKCDIRFSNNPLVLGDPNIRFYAGQPLIMPGGHAIGTLCVIDRVPRNLTTNQQESLKLLAEEVVHNILSRKSQSELKRTTTLLNDAQRISQLGAWELDLATGKTYWTDEVYTIHEVDKEFDHNKVNGIEFYHPEDRPIISQAITDTIQKKIPFDVKCRFISAKGNDKWVRASGYPVLKRDTVTHLIGMFQDVTDQEKIQKDLENAKQAAERASQSKSEFLANMSHEIRTPLNSVIGFSELLLRTPLNDMQKQYMEAVFHSGNSLLGLINDILDFSKIEAGKMDLMPERTDIWELIEHIAGIFRYKTAEKKIEFLIKISSDVPRFINLDPIRIRQVLVNLLGNAIKFTEKGEVELFVGMDGDVKNQEYGRLVFSVRDTGKGISPEYKKKIFEAFSQEDGTVTRNFGGTGLGLTISNKILALMDTKLELESEPGEGSRFHFAIEVEIIPDTGESHWENKLNIKHVLILDDNKNNGIILKEMLSTRSITVDIAEDGMQALKLLEKNPSKYQAAIIDYNLPFMDGITVIQKIRSDLLLTHKELPILLLHSFSDLQKLKEACEKWKVCVQKQKPLTLIKLFQFLDQLGKENLASGSEKSKKEQEIGHSYKHKSPISLKVLIVDDVPLNRLLVKHMIEVEIPNVLLNEAENGEEAIQIYQQWIPDIIFMDIQMPIMSGYGATEKIRELEKNEGNISHTKIIALTAGTVKGEQERCIESGMDDYLSKPIHASHLKAILKKYVKNQKK